VVAARFLPRSRRRTTMHPASENPPVTGRPEQSAAAPTDSPGALSPELNAEIDAAMRDLGLSDDKPARHPRERHHAAEQPLEGAAPAPIRGPRVVRAGREHRTGTVVSVGPTDIFVEFGPKELGVVERSQYAEHELPKVGEEAEVVVNRYEAGESIYLCSRPGAVQKADWEMLEAGQTVEARVTGVNKGGLELEVAGHRAFMPASQVSLERIEDLSVYVGEKLTCQVSRVDRAGKGNIVLSRRDMLKQERAEQAKRLRETLKEGDVVEGVVRRIAAFGAFVDIGGMDGLVHVENLTHERVTPCEKAVQRHVKEGDRVRAQVLKLDWEAKRISLGIKQLTDDPFALAANDISEGADVTGRVTKILEFGAFVEVAPGVEGLVHISEIDWRRIARVEDALKQDEIVTARVLKIDPETRRISLSIKQTRPRPEPEQGAPAGRAEEKPGRAPKGVRPREGFGRRGGMERDTRSPDEILKETPALRRLREKAKLQQKSGGLGGLEHLGGGLGDLKL